MVIQKNRVSLAFASALFRVRQLGHGRLRVGVRQYLPRLFRPRGLAGHALIDGPMPDKAIRLVTVGPVSPPSTARPGI